MNIKKAATSTIAAGVLGVSLLGLGVSAGTASAATQPNHPGQTTKHTQQTTPQPKARGYITITRPNYRPFVYGGKHVTPRYNTFYKAWGFTFDNNFVKIALTHR